MGRFWAWCKGAYIIIIRAIKDTTIVINFAIACVFLKVILRMYREGGGFGLLGGGV